MKLKCVLFLIMILITLPHISAIDTSDWDEVTVNKVTFKIPEKFSNGTLNKYNTGYQHGPPIDFSIYSLLKYDDLKDMYGLAVTNKNLIDIEETEISGHHAVVVHQYNPLYNHDYMDIFFATGKKIFRIYYNSDNVTGELKEIIKSAPKSKMSEETFLNKLDSAQKDYIKEDYEKNLELDMEDYYRTYNDAHNHESYYYWGSNGFGVGGSYRW